MKRTRPQPATGATAIHPLLARAVALHQAGSKAEAAAIYEQIIREVPGHFDATHLLGVVALQEGRLEQAQSLIAQALRTNPKDTAALSNLGTAYLRNHQLHLALEHFERAIKLEPGSIGALTNLGTVLRELGRPREALVPLHRAYSAAPPSAVVCNLLGACLLDVGDAEEAVKVFLDATDAEPAEADGWGNLAVALNRTGELSRAQECAAKAVAMRPDSSAAVAAMAAIEFEQNRIESAIATYREAAALPDASAQTICALGNALWTSGRCDEALDCLRKAVEIDSNNAVAVWKLAMSQCRPFYETEADIAASRDAFSEGLGNLRSWFLAVRRPEAFAAVGTTQPFFLAYQPFNNKDLLSRYGRVCCEWMASMPTDNPQAPCLKSSVEWPAPDRKVRVGIVSAHIKNHSVWNAVTKGWVQHLDRAKFEVVLFHLGRTTDEETLRAKEKVAHFEDRPKTLQAWVTAIRESELDVLIYPEIGMDALTTQLAALRLVAVQATSWGHPDTSGLPTMDLYLSAEGLEPIDAQKNYTESLVRLPNLGVCVEPLAPSVALPNLRALGLAGDEPLLLCPGSPFKYTPLSDRVWARIAKGLRSTTDRRGWGRIAGRFRPKSNGRLVFFRSGNDSMDALLEARLRKAFDSEEVDFDASVSIIPTLDRAGYFGLMQKATLMLDTIGFSGFNNALQAVESGLPVLAYEGEFMRGRLASGIMRRLDLPELVASTTDAFTQSAIALALDPARCKGLRVEIEKRRGILFHDVEPVRALEQSLIGAMSQVANSG
jgi:predicted O-linked N-acetylglucosamine transferase (SPINDLY family)